MHPRLQPQAPEVTGSIPTHIVAVLDESTSMGSKRAETIGTFNKFLDEQKKLPGECHLSLVKFNTTDETVHKRLAIKDVPDLTDQTYRPSGWTALLDAVGRAIEYAGNDKDVIVCIITDGEENSSKSYNLAQIKSQIEARTKSGWNFVFLGAGVNAFQQGSAMGLAAANIVQTHDTAQGMSASVGTMSYAAAKFRSGDKTLSADELVRNYTSNLTSR